MAKTDQSEQRSLPWAVIRQTNELGLLRAAQTLRPDEAAIKWHTLRYLEDSLILGAEVAIWLVHLLAPYTSSFRPFFFCDALDKENEAIYIQPHITT